MLGYRAVTTTLSAATLAVAACGDSVRQDDDEAAATYSVGITEATFPKAQRLAAPSEMRIAVRNTGDAALANVAVTVDSFTRRSTQPGLSDAERPVWIVDQGPEGAATAYVNTWALAGLAPGQTKTFAWKLTPIRAGSYRVKYRVAAGLDGKSKVTAGEGDEPVSGTFAVRIDRRPSASRVDPATGEVERSDP